MSVDGQVCDTAAGLELMPSGAGYIRLPVFLNICCCQGSMLPMAHSVNKNLVGLCKTFASTLQLLVKLQPGHPYRPMKSVANGLFGKLFLDIYKLCKYVSQHSGIISLTCSWKTITKNYVQSVSGLLSCCLSLTAPINKVNRRNNRS